MNENQDKKNLKRTKSVALKYEQAKKSAPHIVGSGQGYMAKKILELAKENHIAIYKDPPLAEALLNIDIGQQIPPELYNAVAQILAFIYSIDKEN